MLTPATRAQPQELAAAVTSGLSSAEAARQLAEFGPNAVVEEQVRPLARIVRHFWAPVPWMLEATIALQVAVGERLEGAIITALLILNVALGVFQESRAGAALALLKRRLALTARVRRDGDWVTMPAAELVPGDIVQLSLGGIVPADARIIAGSVLLDQSMLTANRSRPRPKLGRPPMPARWCAAAKPQLKLSPPAPAPISAALPNWCGSLMSKAASSGRCSESCAT